MLDWLLAFVAAAILVSGALWLVYNVLPVFIVLFLR